MNFAANSLNSLITGDRMILDASRGRAVLKSPWFIRSDGGHGKCIKFRFMFFGHGNHSLHLIQSVNEDLEPTPIWAINGTEEDYKQKLWQYGQVSITGTVRHRVRNEVPWRVAIYLEG